VWGTEPPARAGDNPVEIQLRDFALQLQQRVQQQCPVVELRLCWRVEQRSVPKPGMLTYLIRYVLLVTLAEGHHSTRIRSGVFRASRTRPHEVRLP
jgi:hypothetical protein